MFNCGLHDIKIDIVNNRKIVPLAKYKKNLEKICLLAKKEFNNIIGITTTPVDDEIYNSKNKDFYRFNKNVLAYNKVFVEVAKNNNIPIIDLYRYTLELKEMYGNICRSCAYGKRNK